jgi:hypothetical protein
VDTFTISRTSANTAECDPIVLRETDQVRLVFKPVLLDNPKNVAACVDGVLVYQRKRKGADWEDHNEVKLSQLRADEWVKLRLSAEEVHSLVREVAALYRHHKKHGLPKNKVHLIKVDVEQDESDDLSRLDFGRIIALSRKAGVDVITQFLEWLASLKDSGVILARLQKLDAESLERIGVLARLGILKKVHAEWMLKLQEGDEAYWQASLEEHAFVLSQVVTGPTLVIKGKAYVGGKGVENTGGHLADYLAKNAATHNALLVELKTPNTPLLDKTEYRNGVFAPSRELSGSITQLLTYRDSLQKDYRELAAGSQATFLAFRPRGVVIVGNTQELDNEARLRSFELLRAELKDITVVTFDELVAKLGQLIDALQGEELGN